MYEPWRVEWWWQGRKSSTTFGSKESAEKFVTDMRAKGIRRIYARPV